MISLNELKYYLKLNDSDLESAAVLTRDSFLNSLISSAISDLNSMLNRKLQFAEYLEIIKNNYSGHYIFLNNAPILEVTSLKYWSGDVYADAYGSPEELSESIELLGSFISLRNKNVMYLDLKIEYSAGYNFEALTGLLSGNAATNIITGTDTLFTEELNELDNIIIDGETKYILEITNNTELILNSNLASDHSQSIGYYNDYPEDLREACKKIAAYNYLESRQGEGTLNKSQQNINLGGTASDVYKSLNLSSVIDQYRIQNI